MKAGCLRRVVVYSELLQVKLWINQHASSLKLIIIHFTFILQVWDQLYQEMHNYVR